MSSRVAKEMHLSLLEYNMLFIHKQSRFVRDSGSMSAIVDGCSLGVKVIKMTGLIHVIASIFYQLNIAMSSRVAKEMHLSLLDYRMFFIHKKSGFVHDSGRMSATVDGCSLGVKATKMMGLIHVIA